MGPSPLEPNRQQWVLEALEQYEGSLLRYAGRLTRDDHSARDIVQFAFLRLCDQQPGAIRGNVGSWLYTVCRNRVIDLQRKDRRMETLTEVQQVDYCRDDASPAAACEQQDVGRQLRQIVGTLNADQQEVVDLWSEGFTYREISQITARKENTIRVQVHRALKQLREHPLVRELLADTADLAAES